MAGFVIRFAFDGRREELKLRGLLRLENASEGSLRFGLILTNVIRDTGTSVGGLGLLSCGVCCSSSWYCWYGSEIIRPRPTVKLQEHLKRLIQRQKFLFS